VLISISKVTPVANDDASPGRNRPSFFWFVESGVLPLERWV